MTRLADVIRNLPAITQVHWDALRLIPSIVLESLQTNHPTCRLYYTIPLSSFDGGQTQEDLPYNTDSSSAEQNIWRIKEMQQIIKATTPYSILNSKNLYSLKAHINHKQLFPSEKLELIHQILLTCPNIRELDLHIEIARCASSDQSKCCEDPSRNAVLAFDFTKNNGPLPPLKVLKLEGYRFDFGVNGTHVGTPANTPLKMANLNAWLEHMDWSHLCSLHLSDPLTQTLKKIFVNTLPSLQHFRVDGGNLGHVRAPVLKLLSQMPSLLSLAIEEAELKPLDSFLDIIAEYQTTLRAFKLSQQRDGLRVPSGRAKFWIDHFQYAPAQLLSSAQLTRLLTICPNLQSLDLDMQIQEGWDYEILDTLLSFPQLKELTLRFPPEKASEYFGGFHLQRQADRPEMKIAMTGLRNYLKSKKVGEPFDTSRTFLGWKEFGDGEGAEHGPAWMI